VKTTRPDHPQQKRRGLDPSEIRRVVVLDQPIDRKAPESRRQLQAFYDDPFKEFRGHRMVHRASLKLPRELLRNRIREVAQGLLQLPHHGIGRRETGSDHTRAATRLGCAIATFRATKLPKECPTSEARSTWSASMSATASSAIPAIA
jgi:hypothetical protein